MANGQRRSIFIDITKDEKKQILNEAKEIKIDIRKIEFVKNRQTCYNAKLDKVIIGSDVFPSNDGSTNNRDNMTIKAVLAHEYYGHKQFKNTKLPIGDVRDEIRASYYASVNAPNLSNKERQSLMRDALDRAKDAGIELKLNKIMEKILYGYTQD